MGGKGHPALASPMSLTDLKLGLDSCRQDRKGHKVQVMRILSCFFSKHLAGLSRNVHL